MHVCMYVCMYTHTHTHPPLTTHTRQAFSPPVAVLLAVLAACTNALKAYTGVGGGMLFVCIIKVLDSFGLMGVESGNENLGGLGVE